MSSTLQTNIPTKVVGPIKIIDSKFTYEINVPLATFEAPLWLSVNRGARVTKNAGIKTTVVSDCMSRSILLQAKDASSALKFVNDLKTKNDTLGL